MDLEGGLLTRQGVRVKLQDQPFRILAMLLQRPGEIVSREELHQALWSNGTYVDFDGSLNAALKRLRAALGDDRDKPRFVETVPKRGYRFIAPVTCEDPTDVSGESITGARLSSQPVAVPAPPRFSRFRTTAIVGAVLIAVFLGIVAARRYERGAKPASTTDAAMKPIPARPAIAVIGFHNVSGKTEDAWLAAALSEMMSTELAAGDKLRLVSNEDVSNLRRISPWSETGTLGQSTTSRIGTALNTDLLVLGSYAGAGSRRSRQLRLDVRLQDARSGEILTEVAEIGSEQNLFQLVARTGARMRERLGIPTPEEAEELTVFASMPADSEAARFYILGLAKLRDYEYTTAKDLFEQAIKADPKFPLAYSALSRTCLLLGFYDEAKNRGKQGLDLSGGLSRLQRMEIEANYYEASADRGKGAEIYRALHALYPDNLDYGLQLAKLQLDSYRPEESLATIRELRQLPPPARDDPRLDLREAFVLVARDREQTDRLLHSAAEKARSQGKRLVYAKAQQLICHINRRHLQAPPECQEAYEIFLSAGNFSQAGSCLQLMAEAQRLTGHNEESIPLYERALRIFRQIGDREQTGVALVNLSLVLQSMGKWDRMEAANREAWQDFQSVNDKVNSSISILNIADILVYRGRLQEAAEMYRRGWELMESTGNKRTEYGHIQRSRLWLMEGKPEEARREIQPQIASLREFAGDPWQLASAITALGDIDRTENRLAEARKSYQEALEILKKANAGLAGAKVSLAELAMDEGQPLQAEALLREAIADFEKDKSAGDEIEGYASLGRALLMQNKVAEAREALSRSFKLADSHEFPVIAFPLRILRAKATAVKDRAAGGSDRAAAQRELRAVIQGAKRLGLYQIELEARLASASLMMEAGSKQGRSQMIEVAEDAHHHGFELAVRRASEIQNASSREP